MRSITVALFTAAFSGAVAVAAVAGEKPVQLKNAAGADKVEANCAACHTLDYIPMNSTFLNAAGWDAEVTKMINTYKAAVAPEDVPAIVGYLEKIKGTAGAR